MEQGMSCYRRYPVPSTTAGQYMCVCVFLCVCKSECMCICVNMCTCVYAGVHVYVRIHAGVHVYVRMRAGVHVCLYKCVTACTVLVCLRPVEVGLFSQYAGLMPSSLPMQLTTNIHQSLLQSVLSSSLLCACVAQVLA